jgi:hypothetical protein
MFCTISCKTQPAITGPIKEEVVIEKHVVKQVNTPASAPWKPQQPGRTIIAEVWAFDQPYFYNRLGAQQPTGTIFALKSDIIAIDPQKPLAPGNLKLRDSKRPRPIVIRSNRGDTVLVKFTNMLLPYSPADDFSVNYVNRDTTVSSTQINDSILVYNGPYMTKTRTASFHCAGLNLLGTINSDGTWVGANPNGLAAPGGVLPGSTKDYRYFAAEEGSFLITPGSDNLGMGGLGSDQLTTGLFGAVVVQPYGAEYYRSQVTNDDLKLAATKWVNASGQGSGGLPLMNYDAVYPSTYWDKPLQGRPILNMLQAVPGKKNQYNLVYTDLTAVITGPGHGRFPYQYDNPDPVFYNVPASPDRYQPYREFVTIYHESGWTVQAFPVSYGNLSSTLAAGDDAFSINYASGGIGAEIYSNRIGVGPMANCLDCAYEEFFLSAWAVGDPGMIVDVPANTGSNATFQRTPGTIGRTDVSKNVLRTLITQIEQAEGISNADSIGVLDSTYKATKALYPDDPSNVYHSYLRDHVKFRVLHGGGGVTHVHHQHAHQWLHTPNASDGHYLDSQILNPGEGYTLEMVYNGSGNRNQTVGDQIFHCHFYPHFAGGMWGMWRVHDVFEAGTAYTNTAKLQIANNARALPDAEILSGTPIPAIVPIPTIPMAPEPGTIRITNGQVVLADTTRNPGYPFFIPGVAGSRPPHPPLDYAVDTVNGQPVTLDGGLPRHVVVGGIAKWENHSAYDWTKAIGKATAVVLPETGTVSERLAMKAHATRLRPTVTPEGRLGNFVYNGLPPAQGAPYADPAIDDNGNAVGRKRIYRAANIQMDVVFNKAGWHYPQQRFITLWGDVNATLEGIRPPEPFFFRANTDEYIEYWHTNLVPEYYEMDDYQVRTPTDILGQHIHLVKFDVTSSDGAANGFNYEDGTLSPGAVQERIEAINHSGGYYLYKGNAGPINNTSAYPKVTKPLQPTAPNPIWGNPADHPEWYGAQTTIQRWYADPLLNNEGEDQTLRTVFTHDHFGPSTHQQAGLYAGLLVEPENSTWIDPMTGDTMGLIGIGRQPKPRTVQVDGQAMKVSDGGPTSYQANIVLKEVDASYREFAVEYQDIALAYTATSTTDPDIYPIIPDNAFSNQAFQDSVANYRGWADSAHVIAGPNSRNQNIVQPQLVTASSMATYSTNYRNEPLPLRVDSASGAVGIGQAGDLSFAWQTRTDRPNPQFNVQPTPGSHINPADPKSATYPMQPISAAMQPGDPYTPTFRAYQGDKIQVRTLVGAHFSPHFFNIHGTKWLFEPNSPESGYRSTQSMGISEHFEMLFDLPYSAANTADYLYMPSADQNGEIWGTWGIMRAYNPAAGSQPQLVPLPYNKPGTTTIVPQVQMTGCPVDAPVQVDTVVAVQASIALKPYGGALVYNQKFVLSDTNGLILFRKGDVLPNGTIAPGVPIEPLILRYNAGDCIQLTLENQFNPASGAFGAAGGGSKTVGPTTYKWNASSYVGLSPELLSFDVSSSDGFNVGLNQVQTAAPGASVTYKWYAGSWEREGDTSRAIPMEFGSIVLQPSDLLQQPTHGFEGAIIIEPMGATWVEDANSRASATVYQGSQKGAFREFVLMYNDNVSDNQNQTIQLANYGTQPFPLLFSTTNPPSKAKSNTLPSPWQVDNTQVMSNTLAGEPATPIFAVQAGMPTRFRLATPQGSGNGVTFTLDGHVWQEEPYQNGSSTLGYNRFSEWKGTQGQVGALNPFEILLASAGGPAKVAGDYLYRSLANRYTWFGFWGLMRVTQGADIPTINTISQNGSNWNIIGSNTVNFALSDSSSEKNVFAPNVGIYTTGNALVASASVDANTGIWVFGNVPLTAGTTYKLVSYDGNTQYGSRTFTPVGTGPSSPTDFAKSRQITPMRMTARRLKQDGLTKPTHENEDDGTLEIK